jgi:quinol monooxygenase YgiN
MIHVIATIELRPGLRGAFLAEFERIVPTVLAEAGCIEYGATVDLDTGLERQAPLREDVVVILEKWKNVAALKAHLNAAHMAAYRDRVGDLVTGFTLHILEPV